MICGQTHTVKASVPGPEHPARHLRRNQTWVFGYPWGSVAVWRSICARNCGRV